MSTAKSTPGIRAKHRKGCAAGDACTCTPTWEANVYDPATRRRVFRRFKTRTDAKTWHRDALAQVALGTLPPPASASPTLADALDALLADMRSGVALTRSGTRYKPASIRTYQYQVRVWHDLAHLRLHEVRRAELQRVIDRLRAAGRSASAVHNAVDPIRVVYRRAIRDELVTRDPTTHLELPAVRRKPIDVDRAAEPDKLLDALPDDLRAIWATALWAGLRRGELRALRWSDVDLDRGAIAVSRGWDDVEGEQTAKSEAGRREVPIVLPLRRELTRHKLATGRGGTALVFGATDSVPFSTSTVDRRSRDAFADAGITEPPTLHTGRHATVSRLIGAGLDPKTVQTYAGHSSVTTTFDVYGHLFETSLEADRDRLDAYLAEAAKATRKPQTSSGSAG